MLLSQSWSSIKKNKKNKIKNKEKDEKIAT